MIDGKRLILSQSFAFVCFPAFGQSEKERGRRQTTPLFFDANADQILNCQSRSALCSSGSQNFSSALRRHARTETVYTKLLRIMRLECHCTLSHCQNTSSLPSIFPTDFDLTAPIGSSFRRYHANMGIFLLIIRNCAFFVKNFQARILSIFADKISASVAYKILNLDFNNLYRHSVDKF